MTNRFRYDEENHLYFLDGNRMYGTTTILKEFKGSGGLIWWSASMTAREFGWLPLNKDDNGNKIEQMTKLAERELFCFANAKKRLSEIKRMTPQAYFKLLNSAYRAHDTHKKEKAKDGTSLHEEAEIIVNHYIQHKEYPATDNPELQKFIDWSKKNVKEFLFSEMYIYSEKMFVGGTCDICYRDLQGNLGLGDFKSGGVYFDAFCQVGGYDLQLSENMAGFDASGNKIFDLKEPIKFHSVFPFKNGFKEPTINFDVDSDKLSFRALCCCFKEKEKFNKMFGI